MRLIRLVTLNTDLTSLNKKAIAVTVGDRSLQSHYVSRPDGSLGLLLWAQTPLKYLPKITSESELVLPEQERGKLEELIENVANFVSVCLNSPRQILSPSPCVAIQPETKDDRALLRSAQKLHLPTATNPTSVTLRADFEKHLNELADRFDGVAMLAEALASGHASGRFHEFIRLFERAFRSSGKALLAPMMQFVARRFEFTEDEIKSWLEKRDPITHADQRNEILFEKDVLFEVRRMEIAAYDVLFNKSVWRSQNCDRRSVWSPIAWTNSRGGGVAVIAGSAPTLKLQLLDDFGVYPRDTNGGIHAHLPAEWWTGIGLSASYEATMTLHKDPPSDTPRPPSA